MPLPLDNCVKSLLAKWKASPKSRPEPKKDKSGKPQSAKSQAHAICTASLQRAGKMTDLSDPIILEGVGPVMMGAAVTNRPHLKGLETISIQEGGELRVPLLILGKWRHPRGMLNFTREYVGRMLENFQNDVLEMRVALDHRHKPEFGAVAWFKHFAFEEGARHKLFVGYADPTPAGKKLIEDKQYRYASIEFHPNYSNPLVAALSADDLEALSESAEMIWKLEIDSEVKKIREALFIELGIEGEPSDVKEKVWQYAMTVIGIAPVGKKLGAIYINTIQLGKTGDWFKKVFAKVKKVVGKVIKKISGINLSDWKERITATGKYGGIETRVSVGPSAPRFVHPAGTPAWDPKEHPRDKLGKFATKSNVAARRPTRKGKPEIVEKRFSYGREVVMLDNEEIVVIDEGKVLALESALEESNSHQQKLMQLLTSAEDRIVQLETVGARRFVETIMLRAESYRDDEKRAHPKVLLDWATAVLLDENIGEGDDVIALGDDVDTDAAKSYYRRAVGWLLENLPGAVPMENPDGEIDREVDRSVKLEGDTEEYDKDDVQEIKDAWSY